jgi:hypothetical protein
MPAPDATPEALLRAEHAIERLAPGVERRQAWALLAAVDVNAAGAAPVQVLKERAGLEGDELERLLIWRASRQALGRLGGLPLDPSVRARLAQDLRCLHEARVSYQAGSYHFERAAKFATLRRFPAGPMEWEISGIPRSWFLKAGAAGGARLAWFVAARVGGLAPCFFMHVAPQPRSRALVIEKEVLRSYYRMVRSMEMQPAIRALLACAWFHDPAAVRGYPHLEVLSRPYLTAGGLITLLGPAPPSSGVLEGNARRRADYLAGKVEYRCGFAVWPRRAAIQWARAHPELEE